MNENQDSNDMAARGSRLPTPTGSAGRVRTEYRCSHCEGVVTYFGLMYRYTDGRCPHCGFKGENSGTIMECTEHPYRMAKRPWWKFWAGSRRIYLQNTEERHGA